MSHNFLAKAKAFIEESIAQGERTLDDTLQQQNPTVKRFVQKFYEHVPLEDLEYFSSNELFQAAASTYKFVSHRPNEETKIRVFNPTIENDGWYTPNTVIEVVNNDSPFLVDSVITLLNTLNYTIFQIIHPVMCISRDKSGSLTDVLDHTEQKQGALMESVMHFQIASMEDDAARNALHKEIDNVLQTVALAVADWKIILTKVDAAIHQLPQHMPAGAEHLTEDNIAEVKLFLRWLKDNNFVFLGYVEYDYVQSNGTERLKPVSHSELGIFKLNDPEVSITDDNASSPEILHFVRNDALVEITKSNKISVVHRPGYMDYIGIKRYDSQGKVIGEKRFIGLFTSIVYYQSANLIPIVRKKIEAVKKRAGFASSGHSGKNLVALIEAFPRDELLQISEDDLLDTVMGMVTLAVRPRVRLFIRKDLFDRFISSIIFIPRERYSTHLRQKMQSFLEKEFNGLVSNNYTQISDSNFARLHIVVKTEPGTIPDYDILALEKKLEDIASLWGDSLRNAIEEAYGKDQSEDMYFKYSQAFSISYTNKFTTADALKDIQEIEKAIQSNAAQFALYIADDDPGSLQLKIFNPGSQLTLSDILPILENMGLHVIDGHTFEVSSSNTVNAWIHHFRLEAEGCNNESFSEIRDNFEEALAKIWEKEIQDDRFNKLIIRAKLHWRQVVLLRAYSKYIRQTGFAYSQEYTEEALALHPELVRYCVELFETRFNPAPLDGREEKMSGLVAAIEDGLNHVDNLAEDKVIRHFRSVIMATLRTNYYQLDAEGVHKGYISFKIDSKKVPELPLPYPYKEIFVYSPRVEAIHLRGGKVARGGLRWSDRREDFRTEVLGLMKAQMTKNSVIVPVGSKGGFVVKQPPAEGGREALIEEGTECYKTFLRGMLDITDNIIDDNITPPEDVVRYDEDDPYLVVAADKGTATFSDTANAVAKEYNFWLDDAFASGGSNGYDHKKMGITARGAWVSVMRHFQEMGIDTQKEDFTVVGIGDMAGDVFGNGMLLSKHIRLVAAFNHMHIFLDPNPDSASSYEERKRLFELPRSAWTDYNSDLISKGGGVFERSAKTIDISKEICELLDISETRLAPDELIKHILKAPIDLLWNGGIGTYVKASSESHAEAGDKTNDTLRINGNEVRVKVVGEGGNLGFTQLGRIEFASKGGRINTDAIDNSAGVDCSDHEVNIKIALGIAKQHKRINEQKRIAILEEMTDEVADLVLRDNVLQTQAITIAQLQGHSLLELQHRLIRKLERDGMLDRAIEFLPDDEEISRRLSDKRGLYRPEIAVLLAYSKLSLYDDLLNSNLPDDSYFLKDLIRYFPVHLQKNFTKEIESHPLRREIIATFATNSIVNRVGSTFFHQVSEDTGIKGCDIARGYTVTRDTFDLRTLWLDIEALDGKIDLNLQASLFIEVQRLIEHTTLWFLRNTAQPMDVTAIFKTYGPGIQELFACLETVLPPVTKEAFEKKYARYVEQNIPEPLAKKIAGLIAMSSAPDIVKVATGGKLPVNVVARVYFELGNRLNVGWVRSKIYRLNTDDYWQRLSVRALIDGLYDQQMRLTARVIDQLCNDKQCSTAVDEWCEQNKKDITRYDRFMLDLMTHENPDFSMLMVATKKLGEISCDI